MKLSNLTESNGEHVLAFSDEIDSLVQAAEESGRMSTKQDTFEKIRKIGTAMFKAGMEFRAVEPSELTFDKVLESGATVEAWFEYKMAGKWAMSFNAIDKLGNYVWEGVTLESVEAEGIEKILQKIDQFYDAIDTLNVALNVLPKKAK